MVSEIVTNVIGQHNNDPLAEKAESLYNQIGEGMEESQCFKGTKSSDSIAQFLRDVTKKDEYKKLTLFPDTEELENSVEVLRANKTKGAYRGLNHYLDIHTRLLREDYIEPIRLGIKEYKENLVTGEWGNEKNLRFYYDGHLVKMGKSKERFRDGISHFVRFHITDNQKSVSYWEHSKKLLFGSLLCFSKDNFETTIFATVAERDIQLLARGIMQVTFQSHLEDIFTSSEMDYYVIGETTAFFESYRHVLEGLQEMNHLPLERYILSCCREIEAPVYADPDQVYNLSCIYHPDFHESEFSDDDDDDDEDAQYLVTPFKTNFLSLYEDTDLNGSQMKALKIALTKELAVIQGPPGTGKTYVGLKIMNVLLATESLHHSPQSKGPILIVCFTNHALDQFIEGILPFCQNIVRVGGRSKSVQLVSYNLKEIRNRTLINKRTRGHIGRKIAHCAQRLARISQLLERCWQELLKSETTILTADDLKDNICSAHLNTLLNPKRLTRSSTHIIRQWLKAASANMDNHLKIVSMHHLASLIGKQESDPEPDSTLTSERMAVKTGIMSRFRIYHGWLGKYKTVITSHLEKQEEHSEMYNCLLNQMNYACNNILNDTALKEYMTNESIYQYITECVKNENGSAEPGHVLRQWLLGCLKSTDQLLDAIERLSPVKASANLNSPSKIGNNAFTSWVVNDDSDDDTDEETYGAMILDMDDIEDAGDVNKEDYRYLEETFEQSENKDMLLLQRAHLLGIDMAEHTNEDEKELDLTNTMTYRKVMDLFQTATEMSEKEIDTITDVWDLKLPDRYRLYKNWVILKRKKLVTTTLTLTHEYNSLMEQKKEALALKDVEILSNARVIGMTTTGAARHRKVLQEVGCPIIVVEEAAEVLEAHIVTTLNKNCKHLILIGDHQQLRPNPTVYRLAKDFELEISLFERLIKNRVPHVTLREQHRMRPEISSFMHIIYPNLKDHESVNYFDSIAGMKSNVFFLNHNNAETVVEDSQSKANQHEADFIVALCNYLLQHGYRGSQITVLAAYGGQVNLIRTLMGKDEVPCPDERFAKVKITTVDNFQGEENDIILLSLVRSNEEGQVGFLKVSNRICVALSRAKKGFYAIGNFTNLRSVSELWRKILTKAEGERVTGSVLPLTCINHLYKETHVITATDFDLEAPEGGCNLKCEAELSCGHRCLRMCHASDRDHLSTICNQPCQRTCQEGHQCQKKCSEDCGNCEFRVTKTIPLCGHNDKVPCHLTEEEVVCSQDCGIVLECKHPCRGKCGQCLNQGHLPCKEKMEKEWPCKHKCIGECYINVLEDPCPSSCGEKLNCGHICAGTCGGCLGGRVHKACNGECKKLLPCGHLCKGRCGVKCPPCMARCINTCRHGGCSKSTCGDPCEPCIDNCLMTCRHHACKKRCIDDCTSTPCHELCRNIVPKCKHKCASLCGEECVCRVCEKQNFYLLDTTNKKRSANEKQERVKKFKLIDDVVFMKVPRCNHVFTVEQLDKYVDKFNSLRTSYLKCPVCPNSLHGCRRYDTKNKLRTERREYIKRKIIESLIVSENEIEKLKRSKRLVEEFCLVDEDDFLLKKPDQIDCNHAHALSKQICFGFALQNIQQLHKDFNSNKQVNFKKWKTAVEGINQRVTKQVVDEFELELWRLLLIEQVMALSTFIKEMQITMPDKVKCDLKSLLHTFAKFKLSPDGKKQFQGTVKEMFGQLELSPVISGYRQEVGELRGQAIQIENILTQIEWQDLFESEEQTDLLDTAEDETSEESADDEEEEAEEEEEIEDEKEHLLDHIKEENM